MTPEKFALSFWNITIERDYLIDKFANPCVWGFQNIIFFHDSHDGLILEFLKDRKNYITNKTLSQSYYSYILEGTLYKRNLKFYYKLIERVKLVNFFFFNRDLNRGWLAYMFSLRFSGSKFLINLLRQFRVRKNFSCT